MPKTNVLIVEDDPIIALELSTLLSRADYRIVATVHTAAKAIDRLGRGDVHFAVLDIHLGSGQTGIDVARVIHEKYAIPYLFLTSFSDPHTLEAAKEQAPYGYLVKPFQEATLLSTIAIALSNFQRLQEGMDFSQLPVALTPQEQRLCELLSQGQSYQQMADALFISINTVRYHIKNLYAKLDVGSRAEAVRVLLRL
ncbi:MAG: response regulator transcription factor [Bacteroidota bacterium]